MYFLSLICLSTILGAVIGHCPGPEPRPHPLKHVLETIEGVYRSVGVLRVCRVHIGHVDIRCGATGTNGRMKMSNDPPHEHLGGFRPLITTPSLLVPDKHEVVQPPRLGPLKSVVGELPEVCWHVDYDRKLVPSTQRQYVNDEPKRKRSAE
jgi:hypothetical protein